MRYFWGISLLLCAHSLDAYKILQVFNLPSRSHGILGDSMARLLAEADHQVTYITPFGLKDAHKNIEVINISSILNIVTGTVPDFGNMKTLMENKAQVDQKQILLLTQQLTKNFYEVEEVASILNDSERQFDLVIIDWTFFELHAGLAAVYQCPFIWMSTLDPHWMITRLIDESLNPAYNADNVADYTVPFTFKQRLESLWSQIKVLFFKTVIIAGSELEDYENIYRPILAKRGRPLPPFDEIKYNASLIIGNSYVSLGAATRLPQSYKSVGGYHINEAGTLPEDLQTIMDNAKNGVIYFSMGSMLQSKDWPQEIKEGLLQLFGKLNQTVIWKFEEKLSTTPPNVHLVQWAPQSAILTHPNCILFITHGGQLSVTETIHYGVPLIGIPVYGDQFVNIKRVVDRGFGKKVDFTLNIVDDLKVAVRDILTDPEYRAKAKDLSFVHHDRLVPPARELVHWVEHVVRTRGAPHLRSPALLVPLYQKVYLDLAAIVLFILCLLTYTVKRLFFSKNTSDYQKDKHI